MNILLSLLHYTDQYYDWVLLLPVNPNDQRRTAARRRPLTAGNQINLDRVAPVGREGPIARTIF